MLIVAGKQKRGKAAPPAPSESVEQQHLFTWAAFHAGKYPELELLHHIPNEGKRSRGTGGRMKAEGMKAGVPDVCLPVARGGWHGLYIEMKKQGGTVSKEQSKWLYSLSRQGYLTAVCYGWEAAAQIIKDYLDGKSWRGSEFEPGEKPEKQTCTTIASAEDKDASGLLEE